MPDLMGNSPSAPPNRTAQRPAGERRRLLLAGALIILSGLWVLPVCDPSEARYAEVSREMAAGGSWLVPHLQGRPHLTKPPLTYWLGALCIETFGPQAWAVRLPVAFAFLLTVMITADLGKHLWSRATGDSWAGWVLLFSLLPLAASSILTSDSLLALFETASIWCAWRCITAERSPAGRAWALGFHGAVALAFLTKGPPGLLVPAAFAIFALRHRRRYRSGRLLDPLGFLLLAVLTVPWYLAVARAVPGVAAYWWDTEIVERTLGESHRDMPFYFYLPILVLGSLPGAFVLPWAARSLWLEIRQAGPDAPAGELLLWWIGLPLIVFCASRSRLIFYVLPLFPPLALLCERWLSIARRDRPLPARQAIALATAGAVLLVVGRVTAPFAGGLLNLLGPDPRPSAAAIASDANASGLNARVFYVPSKQFPSCGLAFYLRSTVEALDLGSRVDDEAPERDLSPRKLRCVLEEESRPGTIQYFAVIDRKSARFQAALGNSARGRWLISEGPVRVWKRERA